MLTPCVCQRVSRRQSLSTGAWRLRETASALATRERMHDGGGAQADARPAGTWRDGTRNILATSGSVSSSWYSTWNRSAWVAPKSGLLALPEPPEPPVASSSCESRRVGRTPWDRASWCAAAATVERSPASAERAAAWCASMNGRL